MCIRDRLYPVLICSVFVTPGRDVFNSTVLVVTLPSFVFVPVSYTHLENGNISVAISGTNDPDGKIAKENAERKAKENREKEEKEMCIRDRIEEQQNIMAEMLQEIQEKDEKLMCFQEQEERLQQLESELSELLQICLLYTSRCV